MHFFLLYLANLTYESYNTNMQKIHYVNILLVLLVCIILAKVASDIVSHRLSHTFPASKKQTFSMSVPSTMEVIGSFSPILEKGLFGKATQGKLSSIEVNAGSGKAADSPGDLVLLGTATGSFRETFALLQKLSTHEEKVFRLGEKVFDLGQLVSVSKEFVEILTGGRRVKILTPTAAPQDTGKDKDRVAAASGGFTPQATAPGSYLIDQRALNAALDNIGQAMTDARLLPSMKDGKVEGFRVSEVKPAGIFGMVGIKNGDTLIRINDFSIDSPEKAIQSLASMKGQSRIKLDRMRDGQPTTLNYEIR
jgi:general secretion pathway protein C